MSVTAPPGWVSGGNLVYRADDVPRFVSAAGCFLVDDTGRRYLDATAGSGTAAWGYDPDVLEEALRRCRQLPGLPSFCESNLRLRVLHRLERLVSEVTGVPGRVDLDLGGAQAMETALRIAFSANGPGTVVVFEGAFHGRSGVTSMLSCSPRYREILAATGLEVVRLPSPDCSRCPHAGPSPGCTTGCRDAVTRWGTELSGVGGRSHARGVSAFVFEAVQNVGGMVEPDPELLRAAVDHARAQGAVVIADEIFTGMYRTGPRWGFQRAGVTPDVVVASKGLTNGAAAASMVWAREPLAAPQTYLPGSHSATYVGNPHALAVIDSVLDRFEAWGDVESRIAAVEASLQGGVDRLAWAHPELVESVTAVGATARIVLRGPRADELRRLARSVRPELGVLLAVTGMAPAVVNIHPALVITDTEVDVLTSVLDEALQAMPARAASPRTPEPVP